MIKIHNKNCKLRSSVFVIPTGRRMGGMQIVQEEEYDNEKYKWAKLIMVV